MTNSAANAARHGRRWFMTLVSGPAVRRFRRSGPFPKVNRVFNYGQRVVMNDRESGLISSSRGEIIAPLDMPPEKDWRVSKGESAVQIVGHPIFFSRCLGSLGYLGEFILRPGIDGKQVPYLRIKKGNACFQIFFVLEFHFFNVEVYTSALMVQSSCRCLTRIYYKPFSNCIEVYPGTWRNRNFYGCRSFLQPNFDTAWFRPKNRESGADLAAAYSSKSTKIHSFKHGILNYRCFSCLKQSLFTSSGTFIRGMAWEGHILRVPFSNDCRARNLLDKKYHRV